MYQRGKKWNGICGTISCLQISKNAQTQIMYISPYILRKYIQQKKVNWKDTHYSHKNGCPGGEGNKRYRDGI